MKSILRLLILTLFSVVALSACSDGKAEQTGEKIDEAITDAGNAIEDACEKVKEKAGAKDDDC